MGGGGGGGGGESDLGSGGGGGVDEEKKSSVNDQLTGLSLFAKLKEEFEVLSVYFGEYHC